MAPKSARDRRPSVGRSSRPQRRPGCAASRKYQAQKVSASSLGLCARVMRQSSSAKMRIAWARSGAVARATCDGHATAPTAGSLKRRTSRFSRLAGAPGVAAPPGVPREDARCVGSVQGGSKAVARATCDDHAIASTAGGSQAQNVSIFSRGLRARFGGAAGAFCEMTTAWNRHRVLPGPPAMTSRLHLGRGLSSAETVNFPRLDCTLRLAARQARPATMTKTWERDRRRCESRLRRPRDCP